MMVQTYIADLEFANFNRSPRTAMPARDRAHPKKHGYRTQYVVSGKGNAGAASFCWTSKQELYSENIATTAHSYDVNDSTDSNNGGRVESVTTVSCAPDVSDTIDRSVELLETVYLLDGMKQHRRAVDVILDHVDDLLIQSEATVSALVECDQILSMADVTRLSDSSVVSLLGITLGARSLLKKRRAFYLRSLQSISQSSRGPDGASRLLTKYE